MAKRKLYQRPMHQKKPKDQVIILIYGAQGTRKSILARGIAEMARFAGKEVQLLEDEPQGQYFDPNADVIVAASNMMKVKRFK